ncbi:MAG TPA: DUF3015 family protein [Bdellovibrionota bacterium]|nr:DUF3015 family protein [Bdellovibrionota bacterium]
MKKLALLTLAAVALTSTAFADELGMRKGGYGMGGCGLGSMVFEKNSKVSQVFAATTNGSFGTQTFGITSGTSNCTGGGTVKLDKQQEVFVSMNFETLTNEMSRGQGETLAAFSHLLGCQDSAQFGKFTQSKFDSVFSKAETPEELLGAVKGEVASNAELACHS